MAMLLGFSSKVLQSSQSRNFDAFLAGNSPTGQEVLERQQKPQQSRFYGHPKARIIKEIFQTLVKILPKLSCRLSQNSEY